MIKKVVAGARIYDERNEKVFLAHDTAESRWGDVGAEDLEKHQKDLEGNYARVSLTYAKAFLKGRLDEVSKKDKLEERLAVNPLAIELPRLAKMVGHALGAITKRER